jgi:hypothetical protein
MPMTSVKEAVDQRSSSAADRIAEARALDLDDLNSGGF